MVLGFWHGQRSERGHIRIFDRGGLKVLAQGSYGLPEAEYARLLGMHRS